MHNDRASTLVLYARDGRRKYLAPDERLRFMEAASRCGRPDVETLCLMLAYTGCRISEALTLRCGSVDRAEAVVVIRSLKKRDVVSYRQVPLPLAFVERLAVCHGLVDQADAEVPLWRLSRTQAWTLIKRVMRSADISGGPHATPKGLRHGFGVHALTAGVPITLVKRYLGHARLETTEIYLDVVGNEERELASRMWLSIPDPPSASDGDRAAAQTMKAKNSGSHGQVLPALEAVSLEGTKTGIAYGTVTAPCAGSTRLASAQELVQLRPLRAVPKGPTFDPPPVGRGLSGSHTPGMVPGETRKTGDLQMTKETKKPTHFIWQVIGDGENAVWNRIGAAWENKDGKGLNLVFDAYPTRGHVTMRVASEKRDNAPEGQEPKE